MLTSVNSMDLFEFRKMVSFEHSKSKWSNVSFSIHPVLHILFKVSIVYHTVFKHPSMEQPHLKQVCICIPKDQGIRDSRLLGVLPSQGVDVPQPVLSVSSEGMLSG